MIKFAIMLILRYVAIVVTGFAIALIILLWAITISGLGPFQW